MARPARHRLRSDAAARTAGGRGAGGDDRGFTLIELMVAMTIFAMLMTSFGLLLSYSLKSYRFARARTVADQIGGGEIEKARQLSWDSLGTLSGNPPGTLVPSQVVTVGAASYTVTRKVELVDDAVPTYGYNTGANYKRVTITVSSPFMTKALSYETVVAPPSQPSLYSGVVKATAFDTFNHVLPGATVTVSGGPSALRSDTTNSAGLVAFPALTPTTVAQPNYTVTPSMAGWKLDPADSAAQTISLSAGQTQTPQFHLYKPVTLTVYVVDLGGAPVTTPVDLTIKNAAGTAQDQRSFTSATGSIVLTNFGTGDFVPNYAYQFIGVSAGYTTSPAYISTPLNPANYPTATDASITVQIPIPAKVPTTFAVVDKVTGTPLPNVAGTLVGGPANLTLPFTSDAAGNATLLLLPGTYAIAVASPPTGYYAYTGSIVIPTGNTTPISTSIQVKPWDPPLTMTFTTRSAATSTPLGSVAVALDGGPSGPVAFTTDAVTGVGTASIVPGTYTVTVTSPPTGYLAYTGTATVSAAGNVNVDLAVAGALTVRTKDSSSGAALPSVAVKLVGPGGTTNLTTNASGNAVTYLAPGAYTVTVTSPPAGYAPFSGAVTVTSGAGTFDVALQKLTAVTLNTVRTTDGNAIGNVAVTLVGPSGTMVVSTNGSGTATQSLLPGTYAVTAPAPSGSYQAYTGSLTVTATAGTATVSIDSTPVSQPFRTRQNGANSGGIGGVNVTLTGAGGTYTFTTTSGGSGAGKSTQTIVPGTYTVTVSPMPSGYTTLVTTTVTVPESGNPNPMYLYFS